MAKSIVDNSLKLSRDLKGGNPPGSTLSINIFTMGEISEHPESKSDVLVDVLTADVKTLQSLLLTGSLRSTDLVEMYLTMIKKHDDYLHAMLSIAPRDQLQRVAAALDQERSDGRIRGPLHGIPIVIKDNIATHPSLGMQTTCGSLALQGMIPYRNAKLVDKLIDGGVIILGKTNLSEWAYFRGSVIPSGWSGLGGQAKSAYVRGGVDPNDSKDGHSNPSGSSSGSAIAVSAEYAPFSIGTETDGSLVSPADRAALYTIKPSIGLVSQDGIIPISHNMDSAGPMAKTPYDLAVLLSVIADPIEGYPGINFGSCLEDGSWDDLTIATVNYTVWWPEPDELKPVDETTKQMHYEIQQAYDRIKLLAKKYLDKIPLVSPSEYDLDGKNSQYLVMLADFKKGINKYLSSVKSSKVRNLDEIIAFNQEHADIELPPGYDNQNVLIDAANLNLSTEDYDKYLAHMRGAAREGLDKWFEEAGVDVIIGPAESPLASLASGSGYPIVTLPLGLANLNGRPFGMAALAGKFQEAKLFKLMNAWEKIFGPRKAPPVLQKGSDSNLFRDLGGSEVDYGWK